MTASRTVTVAKANERAQKRRQRETVGEERSFYEITLEATNDETKKQLINMRETEITKCLSASNRKVSVTATKASLKRSQQASEGSNSAAMLNTRKSTVPL